MEKIYGFFLRFRINTLSVSENGLKNSSIEMENML